jgi:flagellar basal-body rod modification protein FlgD
MDLSALSATSNVTGSGASAEDRAAVEKEGFLKLLMAQLSNQDPMAPQDSEKYVQQFTNFSMLEQMMNLNKGVEGLSLGQISNNTQEAVRFVGRDVVAKGDALHWDEESGISPVKYRLQDDADKVELKVYNSNGDVVRTIGLPATAGPGQFEWDGTNDEGRLLEPGEYTIGIEAFDAEGSSAPVDTYVRGRVDSVRFDNGYPELVVDGRRLRLSDITEVN